MMDLPVPEYCLLFFLLSPRETGCFHLGGCSIPEVNTHSHGRIGSVFICFISYRIIQQTDRFYTER